MADEVKSSRELLRSLAAYLQSVREEERTKISREIHDELGQALTALKMDLFWIKGNLRKKPKQIENKTDEMISLTDSIIKTVKKISSDLRPGLLDDLGLIPAIEWQAQEFQERMRIPCQLDIGSEKLILDKDGSTALFRIFQEALTNVARHAGASEVKVMMGLKRNMVELKVRDNGCGIIEAKVNSPHSLGLLGMQERAKSFGGEVFIRGEKNKGTTVTVKIPVLSGE
jgi:signal transduction histidine kinase